jgi:hypothetical protein
MNPDWEWVSWKKDGWESVLAASEAPYDRLLQIRAHAAIRKTTDGEYFWRFFGICNEGDPTFYRSLADCQESCEEALKVRQVTDKLDRK